MKVFSARPARRSPARTASLGAAVAEGIRKCQHPPADRNLGQNAIDEMGGGVPAKRSFACIAAASLPLGHPESSARRAEAAPLAREGDQAIVSTRVAMETKEAMREHAAAEEGAKLLLDEARGRLISQCGAREEACELLA
jgi:hypothetical protein